MRKLALLAIALLCVPSVSCRRWPAAPQAPATLEVFVFWEDQGLPDRRLEIVELGLVKSTDAAGVAVFRIPAGTYTLRAFVNRGGPPSYEDVQVTVRPGRSERVEVWDCTPCVSAG